MASTVSSISLQTLSLPGAGSSSHKAHAPKPALAHQTNRRKLLFFSLTAMPVLTAREPTCFAEDIPLFGLRKNVRRAEEEAVKLLKEAERDIETAEKDIETAETEIVPLFGLRKSAKDAVKLVKEAEREIDTAEKNIETAEKEIEAGVGFGGLAQAGAVAGAEVVGVLVATSVVNGILAPQK